MITPPPPPGVLTGHLLWVAFPAETEWVFSGLSLVPMLTGNRGVLGGLAIEQREHHHDALPPPPPAALCTKMQISMWAYAGLDGSRDVGGFKRKL